MGRSSHAISCCYWRVRAGVIKVAEFIVSRRHLSLRTYAGFWNDPDGTSGTMLHVVIHNQGRRASLVYVAYMVGAKPPSWWRRRIRRFDPHPAKGMGLMLAQYEPARWLESGESHRVEARLEVVAQRAAEIRERLHETREVADLLTEMYAQVECGEGHEHPATLNANSRADVRRFADTLQK